MNRPVNTSTHRGGDENQTPTKKSRKARDVSVENIPAIFERRNLVGAVERSSRAAAPTLDVKSLLQDAREILLTDDGASWVYHVPEWYQRIYEHHQASTENEELAYASWFEKIWAMHPEECGTIKLYGREIKTPRFQQAYGLTMQFSGATFPAKPFPDELQHAIQAIQQMLVDPTTGKSHLVGGLLNWYANGDHYMGPHTDKSVNIHAGSPIFSLTLGPAQRRFKFTPTTGVTAPPSAGKRTVEMVLGDGDLLIMGGTTQETHKHALPKMKKCKEKRVNVTLRYFK